MVRTDAAGQCHPLNAERRIGGSAQPGMGHNVRPVHLVVERLEPKLGFRLRFRMPRPTELLDLGRRL